MLEMMFVFQVLPQSQQHVWRAENAPTCALLLLSTGRRPHSQRIGGEEAEEAFAYIYIFFPQWAISSMVWKNLIIGDKHCSTSHAFHL